MGMNNLIDPKHYNNNALKGMFYIKGYDKYSEAASEILNVNEMSAIAKIRNGRLTHEDTIALCQGLHMTPRQYCEIFMVGVFTEDE